MTLPSVSVVIPTYNRRSGLPIVLDAISGDPYVYEIVVVVDGCDDGSSEYLQERALVDTRITPIWQENAGEGAARQAGIEAATGEVVLILDDDVVAWPRLAQGHAKAHEQRTNLVVQGYMPTKLPYRRQAGDFATVLYASEYEQACERYENDPQSVLRHLWAGNISMRRKDALRVGFAGEHALGYHDDQSFGLRCLQAGLEGVFDRRLIAQHVHSRSLESFARQANTMGRARRTLMHQDSIGSVDWSRPSDGLNGPMKQVIRLASSPGARPITRPAMMKAVDVFGALHLWKAETASARVLRRIEVESGFNERDEELRQIDIRGMNAASPS
jgi:GT2 family glycosyltransferase